MIIGTAITLGGLAYTVLYSVYNYSGIKSLGDASTFYIAALALYNGCAIAALATQHPCYQFIDVGVCAFLVNLLFVFYPANDNVKTYAATLKATLFLAFLALFANIANCADGCCK